MASLKSLEGFWSAYANPFASRFFISLFVGSIFLCGIARATEQNAIVNIRYKASNLSDGWLPLDIYVNDEFLGILTLDDPWAFTIDYKKTFRFKARQDGNNILTTGNGGVKETNDPDKHYLFQKVQFHAFPSQIANVNISKSRVDNRIFFPKAKIDIEINVDGAREKNTVINKEQIKILTLTLDTQLKAKVLKESPIYRIPKGHEKIVEDSVKIVHTVTTTDESLIDKSLKLSWGFIKTGIRKEVQKSTKKSEGIESQVKRSIKIIGNSQAVKVVWSELYRTGTVKVEVDGKLYYIPFEYKEDFDLSLILVN